MLLKIWLLFAYFGPLEGFRAIISNKKLYSIVLLFDTNVLSYISPFYYNFENLSFLTFSTFFRPLVQRVKPQNLKKLILYSELENIRARF